MNNMSLLKKDAASGGGIEGAFATLETVRFVDDFDYGGRVSDKQAAIFVNYEIDGRDKPWAQHFSLGKAAQYQVSDDGYSIKGKLNKSSVAAVFLGAFEDAVAKQGLDIDTYFGDGVEALNGLRVRLTNVSYETPSGDKKDAICVGEIVVDEPAVAKKGAAKAAASVDDITETVIQELLSETSPLKKADLPQLVAASAKGNPNVKAMTQLCFKEAWLADEARPWSYDRKAGKLKAA